MPVYEYECGACGHQFEEWQKIKDDPIKVCPKCQAEKVERLISQTAFHLKGGGWYSDLYSTKKSGSSSSSEGGGGGGEGGGGKPSSGDGAKSSSGEAKASTDKPAKTPDAPKAPSSPSPSAPKKDGGGKTGAAA
jgi:putative FmdB family regulatory protein